MAQVKSVKRSHSEERNEPYISKSSHTLSNKRRKTTKNSWVDKDLTKSPKKKFFEENRMLKRTEPLKTGRKKS